MNCVICRHGATKPGEAQVSLQKGDAIVIIRNVPAEICENCQEYYLSAHVTEKVLEQASAAVARGAEIEVVAYAA
jgi:YgiT-type zinc finger domain-containing protein